MEKVRTRDFIYTTDGLFFASTNYVHPEGRYISFLRYVPDENGDREKNGKRYRKVSSEEAYEYLSEKHPEYLYNCEVTKVKNMMGVPFEKVEKIIRPQDRLKDIMENGEPKNPEIIAKLLDVANFFHYVAGIDYDHLGISGSILPGLHKSDVSDIDFVIFGLENHRKAMRTFRENKGQDVYIDEIEKSIKVMGITDDYWDFLYDKRIKDDSLTNEEFKWYENRKGNRGTIDGTLFDILATKDYDEIEGEWGDTIYEPIGVASVECKITSALGAFDNPSLYTIEDLKIIDGVDAPITELVSFTHTYAGEVEDGEEVVARGKVEKVIKNSSDVSYRLVVGTTRESIDEYIKLKESPA